MRKQDEPVYKQLSESVNCFEEEVKILVGITHQENRHTFISQIVESLRRVKYFQHIRDTKMSETQTTYSENFDPLKAATYYFQSGNLDEAFWLVFLATHFGKNKRTGWKLARDIYWALGEGYSWNWQIVSQNPQLITEWLTINYNNLKNDGVARYFGNHRKYETLKPGANRSTSKVIESYINWIGETRSHEVFLNSFKANDRKLLFREIYNSMSSVVSFARTGKFDYLTTLSNLSIAPIIPDSAYLIGSTGPLKGARLLFEGSVQSSTSPAKLEISTNKLDEYLNVGMQVLEDSLCNWQKSPREFIPFRG